MPYVGTNLNTCPDLKKFQMLPLKLSAYSTFYHILAKMLPKIYLNVTLHVFYLKGRALVFPFSSLQWPKMELQTEMQQMLTP